MKKIITLFIAITTYATGVVAQSISPQVIASNGTFSYANGYSLSYTTGQIASATFNTGSSIITQGFQQPNDVYTGLQTFTTPSLKVQLYPNPAVNEVNLVITSPSTGNYIFQLVDLLGRVLQQSLATQVAQGQSTYVFNVQQLPQAMYFITVQTEGSSVIHTFKFNKIN